MTKTFETVGWMHPLDFGRGAVGAAHPIGDELLPVYGPDLMEAYKLLEAEVERLVKWADEFSAAQLHERRCCEDRIKELEKLSDAISRDCNDTANQRNEAYSQIMELKSYLEISPDTKIDGIAARDETIRMLQEEHDKLRKDAAWHREQATKLETMEEPK